MTEQIHKYPRTYHLRGSRLQPGDKGMGDVSLDVLDGAHVVVEEKIDGANAAVSFIDDQLHLQSRGHYLTGGYRERHFALFKTWATTHQEALFGMLGNRYVMYGEWVYAKHTVFYDALPHYFLEFDVLDLSRGVFLDTDTRRSLLNSGIVKSVPVLADLAPCRSAQLKLQAMIQPSLYKTQDWQSVLRRAAGDASIDVERVMEQTDRSSEAEGLYLKVEGQGEVLGRYKFVRASFLTSVTDADSHWLDRPIIPNQLAPGIDIYGGAL